MGYGHYRAYKTSKMLSFLKINTKVMANLYPLKFAVYIFGDIQSFPPCQLIMQFSNQIFGGGEFQFKCSWKLCGFL